MKKERTIIGITIALCIAVFFLTLLDYLALHDIHKDYISPHALEYLEVTVSKELPDWTTTSGEWGIVNMSYISRFLFFIFNAAVLIMCLNRTRKIQT